MNDLIHRLKNHYYVSSTTDTDDLISETIACISHLEKTVVTAEELICDIRHDCSTLDEAQVKCEAWLRKQVPPTLNRGAAK